MSVGAALITADEFMDVCEDLEGLCELVRGEVREMTRPTTLHGCVCANICGELWAWSKPSRRGRVVTNDAGVLTARDPDTVRGPDLYFLKEGRLPAPLADRQWLQIPPELCVEVLSPSERWKDVLDKVAEYLVFGVLEVWVADPDRQRLHIFRPDAEPLILDGDDVIESPHLPELRVATSRFFDGC